MTHHLVGYSYKCTSIMYKKFNNIRLYSRDCLAKKYFYRKKTSGVYYLISNIHMNTLGLLLYHTMKIAYQLCIKKFNYIRLHEGDCFANCIEVNEVASLL